MGLVQEGYSLDMLKETVVPVDDDVSNSLLGLTEKVGGVTLRGFCNLQTLDLRGKRITTGEAVALAQSLHFNASLTSLSVAGNSIVGDGAQQLASTVLAKPTLEHFSGIPLKELRGDSLTTLDLSCKGLSVPEAIVLADLLRSVSTSLTNLS